MTLVAMSTVMLALPELYVYLYGFVKKGSGMELRLASSFNKTTKLDL